MRRFRSFPPFVIAMVLVVAVAGQAFAQSPSAVGATVVGSDYCLGCTLKKQKGAAAQCSIYGHKHALKVERATASDGRDLGSLAGGTLHYLENDKLKEAFKAGDFNGKRIEVTGKLYLDERVIEVEFVREVPVKKEK